MASYSGVISDMLSIGVGVDVVGLRPDVAADLVSMAAEYYAIRKKPVPVNSAFRSFSKQKELYISDPSKAAAPGRSMHNYGYAVDTNSVTANDLESLGLLRKYRFSRPLVAEPWHLERSGIVYAAVRAAGAAVSLLVVGAVAWLAFK